MIPLLFICFIVDIIHFFMRINQRRLAPAEMRDFQKMMERVAGGSFIGVPLSPNEQVLRAVCYCDKATFAHHRLRRVDPLMPIRFTTGKALLEDEGRTVNANLENSENVVNECEEVI